MSIATLNHSRREQTAVRPSSPTTIVVAGLVLALFIGLASIAGTAALLVPGFVFFVAFVAADLAGSRADNRPAIR